MRRLVRPVSGVCAAGIAAALLAGSCSPSRLVIGFPRGGVGWGMFGGGPDRANVSTGLRPPLALAWEYDAGAGFGPASAAVAESTVFVSTLAGEVHAVDLATGRGTGAVDFGAAAFGTPLLLSGRVLVGLSGDGEHLLCYDFRTGTRLWRAEGADVESSLLAAGGFVVAAGLDGSVAAYDTSNGSRAWRYELPRTPGRPGVRSSPASDGTRVFFGTERGDVVAVGLADGGRLWNAKAGGAVIGPLSCAAGRVIATSLSGEVAAFDATTGAPLWSFDAGAPIYGGVAVSERAVLAGTSGGTIVALDPASGTVHWRAKTAGGIGSAPLLSGGAVYVGDLKEFLYALDAGTGEILWTAKLEGRVRASPIAWGGNLIVLAEDHSVLCFREAP